MLTPDEEETLAALSQARAYLHDLLSNVEIDEKKQDSIATSISLIIRTLDKVDQMTRALRREQLIMDEELSIEDHDKLAEKVKDLIFQGAKNAALGKEEK